MDNSSVVSESRRSSVISRDGGLCVLCGIPIDVAHIIVRKSGDQHLVNWICWVAPSLSDFRKDDAMNLICLCPTHHRQYDLGYFVLVPNKQQRESLLEHEHRDFAMREDILAQGGGDPGRTFPPFTNEFEYVPVRDGPYRIHVHNPTPYDPSIFVFDNIDHRLCPLLHFRASHIALMVEAEPHLASVTRLQSPKGDSAESQITTLLRLYRRQLGSIIKQPLSIPSDYESICMELEQPNSQPSAQLLTTVPSSPPLMNTAPTYSMSFAKDNPMPGLTPSSSASMDDASQAEDSGYADDIQLAEYAKEPSITWEDLKNRPRLFAGEELGPWRYASADDICRSRQF